MAKRKKRGDDAFRKETKRLDRQRRRRQTIPVLVGLVLVIALTASPWGKIPRRMVNGGIRFVHTLMGGEVEPDHKYW